MRVINKDELYKRKSDFLEVLNSGILFIYPTDTIYGIGCNATHCEAIKKLRQVKKRPDMPFSVIAPNKEWIINNCELPDNYEKWLNLLPGPYTLILKLKNRNAISREVSPNRDTVGVRIPNHWISEIVSELNTPIITTSANVSGEDFMTSLEDLSSEIKHSTQIIIYEGEKPGRPSKIIDLTAGEKIIER